MSRGHGFGITSNASFGASCPRALRPRTTCARPLEGVPEQRHEIPGDYECLVLLPGPRSCPTQCPLRRALGPLRWSLRRSGGMSDGKTKTAGHR